MPGGYGEGLLSMDQPQNTANGFGQGEGSTGEYGGGSSPNDDDSSGAITCK